ncbi:hypothetical protein ES150_17965 [Enterobacillus tribolii]|nr:hypothetical protein [Enterobacillus tribolii]
MATTNFSFYHSPEPKIAFPESCDHVCKFLITNLQFINIDSTLEIIWSYQITCADSGDHDALPRRKPLC